MRLKGTTLKKRMNTRRCSMTRSRRKGSRRMKRHYSLRGGGLISDIWGAGQFVTDSWWGSYVLGLPGMSRAAMSARPALATIRSVRPMALETANGR